MADKTLSARQRERLFAAEYVKDSNGTQAAIRAGYAPGSAKVTASRLLTRPNVQALLANHRGEVIAQVEQRTSTAIADASWIIQKAVEVVDIGLASAPVRGRDGKVIMVENEDGESVPAGYEAYNLTAVNGALALLSKRLPEFSEKHEVDARVGVMLVRQTRDLNAGH